MIGGAKVKMHHFVAEEGMIVCVYERVRMFACAWTPAYVRVTVCDTQSANKTRLSDEWHCKH